MKHNNSDYKKTFYYWPFIENNVIVATLKYPNSLVDYIENLIFDVIEKRNLIEKRIVFLVDNLWTKQLLQSLLLCRKVIDNDNNILNTTNQITIVEITNDFDNVIYKSIGGNINEIIYEADTFILIDFNVLMNDSNELLERLRVYWKNKLWIGVGLNNEKDTIRLLSFGEEYINYLPDSPETFEGFVNEDVLKGIENILVSLGDNEDSGIFSKHFYGEIFTEENDYTLAIGTSDLVECEYEEEDGENDENYGDDEKSFCVAILITKYKLELSIELQDYDWDGTVYLNYKIDFESDIYEEGDIGKIDDLVEEICERINSQKINVRLS